MSIPPGRVNGRITAPASKSDAQRALAAASLARGRSVIRGCTPCDDTDAALGVIEALGARVERVDDVVAVHGWQSAPSGRVDCGESGLALRMFAAIAAVHDREVTLDGRGTLGSRPIGMIEDALRSCGVTCRSQEGRLPLVVRGPLHGGSVSADGSVTSQHITGLLFALPLAAEDTRLTVLRPASRPYLAMTMKTLVAFGIDAQAAPDMSVFFLPGRQKYRPAEYVVEGDWSGASCLLAAGAFAGRVEVDNLDVESPQADRAILDVLRQAGARVTVAGRTVTAEPGDLAPFEWDAANAPDLVPALVALACHCTGTSRITGIGRLRHKESDRVSAILAMVRAMGGRADADADALEVTGGALRGGAVETRHDHRIAMAAAVAALGSVSGVTLDDPSCVAKSYPCFFNDLRHLRIQP
jgi:3-phosphoshikimate 1-carboxyvinyltransferase